MNAPRKKRASKAAARKKTAAAQRPSPNRRRGGRRRRAAWVLIGLVSLSIALLACVWIWALLPGPGGGQAVYVDVPTRSSDAGLANLLEQRGLVRSPFMMRVYLKLVRPSVHIVPGGHLLNDAQSPRSLLQRLGRLPNRTAVKVTIPEGFHHVQIAERLERREVCAKAAFVRAVRSKALLRELSVRGPSAEGMLFPATYDLAVDSPPTVIVRLMVKEFRKRLARLAAKHPEAMKRYEQSRGWTEHEIATLASIVERETRHADERPRVASVYLNRLDDPDFKPKRRLQADPTAAYGCLLLGDSLTSCEATGSKVTPKMLRDARNPYNTYAHSGLPPGPIANPGEGALSAVLAPEKTEFLFFVARGDGRHTFSRTLAEHQRATSPRPN